MPTIIILRSNHHVTAILDGSLETHVANALAVVERLAGERRSVVMGIHPPVLMIPQVLSGGDCERLIEVFETRGLTFVGPGPGIEYLGTDYKMRIPEHMREDRIDHWIFGKDTMAFLGHRLQRVWPEIRKSFQYHATKQEVLRIGCYHGFRGGHLHGHRDDVPPTTYRRFAMSINLNAESFDGGELRFPEFGDQRYRPETGPAIVFSSSLLHEAMHVTAGRWLVLLAFLFGEQQHLHKKAPPSSLLELTQQDFLFSFHRATLWSDSAIIFDGGTVTEVQSPFDRIDQQRLRRTRTGFLRPISQSISGYSFLP